jgi:hypothetical protein
VDPQQRSGPRYEDGFRDGYRSGYEAARGGRRYDDRYSGCVSNGGADQQARWRQRYSKAYTYTDDSYYQQCRSSQDPAGVIAGALIGGLLGKRRRPGANGGATVAGVDRWGRRRRGAGDDQKSGLRETGGTPTGNLFRSVSIGGARNTTYRLVPIAATDHNGELRVRGTMTTIRMGFRLRQFSAR